MRLWLASAHVGMISDVSVAERARSGAVMAFITVAEPDQAVQAACAIWNWWVRCPADIDRREWRFVSVHWMLDRE
ncbi:MAG: hypothetical protein GY772_00440 [bacterium]|nr:hypothetical protein [bacterium]